MTSEAFVNCTSMKSIDAGVRGGKKNIVQCFIGQQSADCTLSTSNERLLVTDVERWQWAIANVSTVDVSFKRLKRVHTTFNCMKLGSINWLSYRPPSHRSTSSLSSSSTKGKQVYWDGVNYRAISVQRNHFWLSAGDLMNLQLKLRSQSCCGFLRQAEIVEKFNRICFLGVSTTCWMVRAAALAAQSNKQNEIKSWSAEG